MELLYVREVNTSLGGHKWHSHWHESFQLIFEIDYDIIEVLEMETREPTAREVTQMVSYTKVTVDDPAIVALAKEMNVTPKEVAALINQQRYRSMYNKMKAEETKVIRKLIRQHPELVKGVK